MWGKMLILGPFIFGPSLFWNWCNVKRKHLHCQTRRRTATATVSAHHANSKQLELPILKQGTCFPTSTPTQDFTSSGTLSDCKSPILGHPSLQCGQSHSHFTGQLFAFHQKMGNKASPLLHIRSAVKKTPAPSPTSPEANCWLNQSCDFKSLAVNLSYIRGFTDWKTSLTKPWDAAGRSQSNQESPAKGFCRMRSRAQAKQDSPPKGFCRMGSCMAEVWVREGVMGG